MININKANLEELTAISGIGRITGLNIIQYRQKNQGFKSPKEIKNVKGIGDKTYNKIISELTTEEKLSDNKVKITVNPEELGIERPSEIHLVGEMNNWDPEDKNYSLEEDKNGVWTNNFELEPGTEYKIMYDSTEWEDNKYFGNYGANFVVNI